MIALIATVLNEDHSIHRLMRSIVAQSRQPDEVVIVDGGSRDDTVAIIQSYADRLPLRVLVEPGCNISRGRNEAIAAAQADIIAVTDAGVELVADWLEKITHPLLDNPDCSVVGGFFEADYSNLFELAMSATVLPLADEINPATFLPTSRSVAFRKAMWQAVSGYPEWLDYCEDLVFDLRLKEVTSSQSTSSQERFSPPLYRRAEPSASGAQDATRRVERAAKRGGEVDRSNTFPETSSLGDLATGNWKLEAMSFVPDALVAFRPRGSLRAFFKQYYRYARGDGKADLWRKRHAARYLTYLVALPLVVALGLVLHPALWLLLLPGAYIYLRQPYRRLFHLMRRSSLTSQYSVLGTVYLYLLIPVIRVVGDIAKILGYPVGWVWRLRQHPPDWRVIE